MKLKTNLVFLGFIRRFHWTDFDGAEHNQTFKAVYNMPRQTDKKKAGLFAASDAKALFMFPWANPKIEPAPAGFELQKKTLARWAGRPASEAVKISIPANIKDLDHVGFINEIEYTSDKFDRPGDGGKFNLYFHEYNNPGPAVFVNCPIRPYIWAVKDSKGRKLLTYRGLVL